MARLQDRRLRHEAPAEYHAIALQYFARPVTLHLDAGDALAAVHRDHSRPSQHARAEQEPRDCACGPRCDDARLLLDERQCPDACVPHGQQVGEGHQLGADDDRSLERTQVREVDHLLQGAGGDHTPGPAARDESRGTRRLSRAQREQYALALERCRSDWRRQLDNTPGVDTHNGDTGADHHVAGRLEQTFCIARAGKEPGELAPAEPAVSTVARDAAGMLFALQDDDVIDAQARKLRSGGQAGGSCTDDQDRVLCHAACLPGAGTSASRPAASCATRQVQ